MDFKRLTDAIFSRLEPYQLARHYKFAELIYTDGEDLPASWCDGELRPVVDEREWNDGIMYIRQNGSQSMREDEASAFIGCQVMQIGTIPLKIVLIARRSERFTPFDVAQTISSAVSGLYSNLALQIGAQYVNVINTVTESNARVVLEEEFKDLEKVSFDSNLYAISVEIEVEVKGDADCMASDACDPIVPEPILNKVATPVFEPNNGVFGGFGEFTLSCSTPGASIYYTLDGSPVTPQTGILYTGTPVLLVTNTVPKAKAFLNGLVDSDTATAQYQVDLLTLSFNIAGGVFPIDSPPTIVPIINNQDADVYYTTDGSTPTESSTPFTTPFVPTPNVTLTARGFLDPALPSNIVQQVYQLKLNAPVLDTTSGTFISERVVSAAHAAVGVNEYRIDGGAWVVGDSVLLTTSAVVDWRAVAPDYVTSDVVTVNVTIQCAAPTISPNGGIFEVSQSVSIANNEPGGIAYYTIDGTTPTESSLTATPFNITATTQVRTRAFRAGCEPSDIVNVSFTLFQRFELAGIPTGSAGTRRVYLFDNNTSLWGEIQPLGNVDADWVDAQVSDGSRYLLASTSAPNRLLYSLDSGASWALSTFAGALASAPAPRADKTGQYVLCIASIGSGSNLHYSNDYGQTFTQISPLGLTNWVGCFVDREDPLIMYAWRLSASSGDATVLVKSVDGGDTWTAIYSVLSRNIVGFAAFGSTIYMSVENTTTTVRTRLSSTDGGSNFVNFIVNPPATSPLSDAIAANSTMIITRNPNGGQIFVSRDGTATWQTIAITGTAVRLNVNGNRALVGTSNRLYRSTDGGVTFPETQPAGNVNRNWQLASL